MLPPRAYLFISLNIIRALSLVGMLLVFASNILVMVDDIKAVNAFMSGQQDVSSGNSTDTSMLDCDYIMGSTVPNQPAGIFWAVVNELLILAQIVFLILSEIGWPAVFFDRFFPVLGKDFGVGALGVFQCLIGAAILSHKVDDFALVAAFFLFAIGCLNILVGLIFRQSVKYKRSFTSWKDAKKAMLPTHTGSTFSASDIRPVLSTAPPSFVSKLFTNKDGAADEEASFDSGREKTGLGFGRQAEKAAYVKPFLLARPVESLPRYASSPSGGSRPASPNFASSGTAI